jgi:hypothetical protein
MAARRTGRLGTKWLSRCLAPAGKVRSDLAAGVIREGDTAGEPAGYHKIEQVLEEH